MAQKIKMKKGYPTSDGKMHNTYAEAMKSQSEIDLMEAVDKCEGTTTTKDFIMQNSSAVLEFIKYNCTKKPAAAKKKPAAPKAVKTEKAA